jgi:hypothetical protein
MASLSLVSGSKLSNLDLHCLICHEPVRDNEDLYRNSSYLDPATRPRYVVHSESGEENGARFQRFRESVARALAQQRLPSRLDFGGHEAAYLDLATRSPEDTAPNIAHFRCFSAWTISELAQRRRPRCAHCNRTVEQLGARRIDLPADPDPQEEVDFWPFLRDPAEDPYFVPIFFVTMTLAVVSTVAAMQIWPPEGP